MERPPRPQRKLRPLPWSSRSQQSLLLSPLLPLAGSVLGSALPLPLLLHPPLPRK